VYIYWACISIFIWFQFFCALMISKLEKLWPCPCKVHLLTALLSLAAAATILHCLLVIEWHAQNQDSSLWLSFYDINAIVLHPD
jgi:hypothetical protein